MPITIFMSSYIYVLLRFNDVASHSTELGFRPIGPMSQVLRHRRIMFGQFSAIMLRHAAPHRTHRKPLTVGG